jgi:hypothetical protein
VHWKSTAISYHDGVVRLSNGRDREPIEIKAPQKPVCVELYYHRGHYYFSLVYPRTDGRVSERTKLNRSTVKSQVTLWL